MLGGIKLGQVVAKVWVQTGSSHNLSMMVCGVFPSLYKIWTIQRRGAPCGIVWLTDPT